MASAPRVAKTRNNGTMTEAAFRGMIRSLLRKGTLYWKPRTACKMRARHHTKLPGHTARLVFHSTCEGCNRLVPEADCAADHIKPVIDPAIGFTGWHDLIEGLYCELDNFQWLCKECHDKKTADERAVATERKRNEKKAG